MKRDVVDRSIADWRRERPELDASALGVVSRILILAQRLERSVNHVLSTYGLELWQLDVLATLRRVGAPYALSPGQLTRSVFLSSGAMTNRIDRLETEGLVVRKRDPDDRRGVLIVLTPKGRKLADQAIGARLAEARQALGSLGRHDARRLADLLRMMLASASDDDGSARPGDTPPSTPRRRRPVAYAGA